MLGGSFIFKLLIYEVISFRGDSEGHCLVVTGGLLATPKFRGS